MAREESKKISQRVRRGKATGAREGRWNGGMRWYGYQTAADGVWRGPKAKERLCSQRLRFGTPGWTLVEVWCLVQISPWPFIQVPVAAKVRFAAYAWQRHPSPLQ